ncbi:hypothetical protein H6P81_011107 [Aristolochia fimbriata]|uniref:Diacylglycerol O-acyltransferase n=1 Tax=Aristolochia fimbriata TaxID=158543 RepID=A0AAV7EU28_ARIFI|nr:hypothetical protein H6P81_011107 [Aristolochia fimbriata]
MGREDGEKAEPVTPTGRFFLQPKGQNIIHCVVGGKNPIDIEATKAEIENTLLKPPRFCSLLIRDKHGRELWQKTEVEIDNHIVYPDLSDLVAEEDDEEEVIINRYLADLAVSSPLDETKPLWEIHVLQAHRCCVLRVHHALGDGISLMSLFLACCKRSGRPDLVPSLPQPKRRNLSPTTSVKEKLRRLVLMVWFTVVYCVQFVLYSLWTEDEETPISGGEGVELWPRMAATAHFSLDDMKLVKNAVRGTVNDVLFGVIASGLARYLEMRSPNKPSKGLRITGLEMVNRRFPPGLQDPSLMLEPGSKVRWGNQLGGIILPLVLQRKDPSDPLEYVKRAKALLDLKKLSMEAYFSYKMGSFIMSIFGPEVTTWILYRVIAHTTFTISNIVGPQEEIVFAGNPIRFLRASSTSIPHALTMHMVSYMGKAEMQILVAKDIILDPRCLAKCFEDALLEMKDVVSLPHATDQSPRRFGFPHVSTKTFS